jgi:spermidine synthase
VPAHLTTREFLTAVKKILTVRGVVVGNLWGRDVNRMYDSMVKTYRAVYDSVRIVDVVGSGNKILIASGAKTEFSDRDLVVRAQSVSQRFRLRNDLTEVAERNLRLPGFDGETGELLVDSETAEPGR